MSLGGPEGAGAVLVLIIEGGAGGVHSRIIVGGAGVVLARTIDGGVGAVQVWIIEGGSGAVLARTIEGRVGADQVRTIVGGVGAVQVAKIGHLQHKPHSAKSVRQFKGGLGMGGGGRGCPPSDFPGWQGVEAVLWADSVGRRGCCPPLESCRDIKFERVPINKHLNPP